MLPFINIPFDYVANLLGASTDELKLIFSFLISYPLAGVLKRLPDREPWKKNAYIIGVSLFYLVGLFDLWSGIRTLFISAGSIYAIAKYVQGPFMPWLGFVFVMVHMSINHIARQAADSPSSVDITGAQMVMVMKLTAFCWNIHDGRLSQAELPSFQRERALTKVPPVMDYVGYVLFFPGLFAGPAFDYVDYRNYITTTMFDLPAGTDPSRAPPTRKKRKIPRSGTPATIKAVTGLAWILAFLVMSGSYNTEFLLSDSYLDYGFLRRVWILHMYGFTARTKYYGVWALTEGSCILCGIGYNGIDPKTGKANWDRLQNVRPLEIELAQNTRAYLGGWNINTNNWLRNYIYLRVTPKGKKPGFRATLATFFTSAFWHGFYPGYYLAFVLASFLQTIAKRTRRTIRPFFLEPASTPESSATASAVLNAKKPVPVPRPTEPKPTAYKPYYDAFCYLATQIGFSFTVAPFVLLTGANCVRVWASVYFYGLIGTVLAFALAYSPAMAYARQQLAARDRRAAAAAVADGAGGTSSPPKYAAKADKEPILGMPDDPEREVSEIVQSVRQEVEARRRKGGAVGSVDMGAIRDEVTRAVREGAGVSPVGKGGKS